ncbi:FecR family protein [Dyella acidisoli]|uniref:Protein FpvR n=1 Tax=Dyella acidisoli TaxID=1867834 RepID=A0ABQ5XNE1_9GAMM|nr:FecR family protein [Dyella acidisoli]GLQ93093.1 protein FpvR [Dyella acidisoli]
MNMGTNTSSTDNASTASPGEAERWFVLLLEADCTNDERAAFERWLAADPSHLAEYRRLEQAWRVSSEALREPKWVEAANRALLRPKPRPWFQRGGFWAGAAACACALLVVLVWTPRWLTRSTEPAGTTYATHAGQLQTLSLSDGSSIVLDTNSAVVVRYDEQARRVDLLRGQAQFKVHGNHAWPFVVHVQNGTVTAVGTWFQVRIDADATNVTLIEGKLAIATATPGNAPQQASLQSGESLAFDLAGHISAVEPADVQTAESWPEGRLVVHDWRLSDLVTEINRYSTTQLEIGDPSLQDLRVSGTFRDNDVDAVLLLLQRGWPIQAEHVSDRRIVLLRRR